MAALEHPLQSLYMRQAIGAIVTAFAAWWPGSALAAGGFAPYYCMFADGTKSYQDAPCGKQPDPSAKYYDARGKFIDWSAKPAPAAAAPDRVISPAGVPAMCQKQRHLAESDLKANLASRYGSSYSLQLSLLKSNMEAYDNICSTPAPPVALKVINDLAGKYYPNFSLIRSLAVSNLNAYKELHQ